MSKAKDPLVGEFIDAAVANPVLARDLLLKNPSLRNARWIHEETPLHFLAVEYYADAVRLLCELGFDVNTPNEFGDSPLIDVVSLKNHEIAEILLQAGANPNVRSKTSGSLLEIADFNNDKEMRLLLQRFGAKS